MVLDQASILAATLRAMAVEKPTEADRCSETKLKSEDAASESNAMPKWTCARIFCRGRAGKSRLEWRIQWL